jgi:hypothetical protein
MRRVQTTRQEAIRLVLRALVRAQRRTVWPCRPQLFPAMTRAFGAPS